MDLRGKRIEEGYTNLVTVEGDSVASSGKLQNGQGTDLGNVAVGGLSFNSGDSELQLPAGTTAERPASPSAGYARFNTDKGKVEIFTGASWLSIALEGAVQLEAATATVTGQDAVATLSGFISQFGTPASAFSVRQLGDTDVAMRVRRSSDNAEQNIGFTSDGDLDETALTTFVGANDGFVTTWYDQSVDNSTLPAEHGSGATASYSLRKVNSSYTGDAIRVRRASDNTEQDIGFDANGELDTSALDTFVYGATSLPADQGSGATASYSLRKVASAYTGNAIRVRRSSDNTEQDIGFVDGELDTSTLETFCSGTNGFVTTWYDQSGSNDATQATAGSQPQIVSSGSTIKENGKPALDFDGSDDFLDTSSDITINQVHTVFKSGITSSSSLELLVGDVANDTELMALGSFTGTLSGETFTYRDSSSNFIATSESTIIDNHVLVTLNATDDEIYANGTLGSMLSTSGGTTTMRVRIGTRNSSDFTFGGVMQEFIIYDTDQSSNRQDIEHNQAVFYDIAIDGKEAFVTTWYDQSGSNNATQSTAGSQPKIYDGTTIKENGKPALDFDGSDDGLEAVSLNANQDLALFQIFTPDALQAARLFNNDRENTAPRGFMTGIFQDGTFDLFSGNAGSSGGSYSANEQMITSFIYDDTATTMTFFKNSENQITDTSYVTNDVTLQATIGFRANGSAYYNGTIQEVVLHLSDQSSNRESIELNQASYYDIGVSIGATQSTAGSQPKIVSSGTVIKENSQPVVTFDGSDDVLTISGSSSSLKFIHDGGNASIFTSVRTASSSNPTTAEWIAGSAGGSGSNIGLLMGYDDRSVTSSNNKFQVNVYRGVAGTASVEFGVNDVLTPNQINVISVLIDADNATANDRAEFSVNGGTLQTGNTDTDAPSSADSTYDFQIGALGNNVAPSDIAVQEFVIYNADKSSDQSNIESNIATYFNITI